MIKQLLSRQFILFLLTGGIAAAVNFGSRFIYSQWWSFSVAVVFAYVTGMIMAFILAKLFVFTPMKNNTAQAAAIFMLVNLLGMAQTWLVSIVLVRYVFPAWQFTWHDETVAHFCGILFPVFISYFGHKYWSFR